MGEERIIRDAAFARRLALACDGSPNVPPMQRGRLVWLQKQLEERYDDHVSMNTVSKWFYGEARPRPKRMAHLAEMLGVDEVWLSMGVEAGLAPRERKARSDLATGSVNVLAGFIQMGGGHPAFPDENDERAIEGHIDLYAIIKGARYDIHVAIPTEATDGYHFSLPPNFGSLFVIGVVQTSPFCIDAFEIPAEVIEKDGVHRGGFVELDVRKLGGRYAAPSGELPLIKGFDRRL